MWTWLRWCETFLVCETYALWPLVLSIILGLASIKPRILVCLRDVITLEAVKDMTWLNEMKSRVLEDKPHC